MEDKYVKEAKEILSRYGYTESKKMVDYKEAVHIIAECIEKYNTPKKYNEQ